MQMSVFLTREKLSMDGARLFFTTAHEWPLIQMDGRVKSGNAAAIVAPSLGRS